MITSFDTSCDQTKLPISGNLILQQNTAAFYYLGQLHKRILRVGQVACVYCQKVGHSMEFVVIPWNSWAFDGRLWIVFQPNFFKFANPEVHDFRFFDKGLILLQCSLLASVFRLYEPKGSCFAKTEKRENVSLYVCPFLIGTSSQNCKRVSHWVNPGIRYTSRF